MAGSAGSLVVSLGLDAAEYTRGLTKAEYQARQFGEAIGNGVRTAAIGAAAGITAMVASAGLAVAGFNKLLDGAAKFQDLAEETGQSAAGIAGLSVAAATAGVTIESVAGSMNKLTKNLVGVDDESKAAGAALAALGINVSDFKKLDPATQYKAVATALDGFADGAGKTAVAMGLWGKAGAEQLKVAKAIVEQGGETNILTEQQIALADEYRDKQAKTTATLELYASALATQAIPAVNEFTQTLVEVAKQMYGADEAGKALGANTAVGDFATKASDYLAKLIDVSQYVGRAFYVLGDIIGNFAATAGAVLSGEFKQAISIQLDGARNMAKNIGAITDPVFSDSLAKTRAAMKQAEADRAKFGSNRPGVVKPQVNYAGAVKSGGGSAGNSAAQEAKARLDADLASIKNASTAITNTYGNQEKILEAQRSAGLASEETYYVEKIRLSGLAVAAQEDALQKQIARLQQEKLSGKESIDNLKKIGNVEAELAKVREDAAANATVMQIKQTDALEKLAAKWQAVEAAARGYVTAIQNQNDRDLAGMGKGGTQRDKDSRLAGRDDELRGSVDALTGRLQSGEITQADYDRSLDIQTKAHAQALAADSAYWEKKAALQSSWSLGAQEGLQSYYQESMNAYDQIAKVGANAFKGLEDALVTFTQTGKLSFRGLADSIMADIARVIIKQQITGPLSNWLSGAICSASGAGGSTGAAGSGFASILSGLFGKASGGNVSPGGMVRVNENGPELFDYQGKQYLMNGNRNASITPNHQISGGGGFNQSNTFVVEGRIDRSTQSQLANKVRRETNAAATRFA